jgi:hypothetical protein
MASSLTTRGILAGRRYATPWSSAVASAADFELGSVVVTISEVPADKMKPTGSPNQ